ncbi:MAG: TIGR02449 family protein [Gammaproteobacteria bacterium]|nr:TIGR02449 family protein [Gammaproteobacteria bacterium]
MEQKLEVLARRLDELIDTVQRLQRDNVNLREKEKELAEERSRLKAKNAEAKKRLESIIGRLRQHGGESS